MIGKKCDFCGNEVEAGRGKMYVLSSGVIRFYCSSKCEKNSLKLERKPRKVCWTTDYRAEKEIRLKLLKETGGKVKKQKEEEPAEARADEQRKGRAEDKGKKAKKQKITTKAPAKKVSLAKKKK